VPALSPAWSKNDDDGSAGQVSLPLQLPVSQCAMPSQWVARTTLAATPCTACPAGALGCQGGVLGSSSTAAWRNCATSAASLARQPSHGLAGRMEGGASRLAGMPGRRCQGAALPPGKRRPRILGSRLWRRSMLQIGAGRMGLGAASRCCGACLAQSRTAQTGPPGQRILTAAVTVTRPRRLG
jgi:hypothetical protein